MNDILRAITQFQMGNEAILSLTEAYLMEDKQQIGAACENMMEMFGKLETFANRDLDTWIGKKMEILEISI